MPQESKHLLERIFSGNYTNEDLNQLRKFIDENTYDREMLKEILDATFKDKTPQNIRRRI